MLIILITSWAWFHCSIQHGISSYYKSKNKIRKQWNNKSNWIPWMITLPKACFPRQINPQRKLCKTITVSLKFVVKTLKNQVHCRPQPAHAPCQFALTIASRTSRHLSEKQYSESKGNFLKVTAPSPKLLKLKTLASSSAAKNRHRLSLSLPLPPSLSLPLVKVCWWELLLQQHKKKYFVA